MSNFFKKIDGKKTGIFAAGVLFGTAGIKLLTSRDAKSRCPSCKGLHHEDRDQCTGECKRYLCRGKADQRRPRDRSRGTGS